MFSNDHNYVAERGEGSIDGDVALTLSEIVLADCRDRILVF